MSGGEAFGADLASHAKQRLKLHIGVAVGAGDGRAAGEVLLDEGANDARFELLFEIDDVVRKIQMLGHALGVVHVVERAAAMLSGAVGLQFGKPALIPQLHGEADHGPLLLEQYGRNGGGIHAAGHGDSDESRLSVRGHRQGIEIVFAWTCLYLFYKWKASDDAICGPASALYARGESGGVGPRRRERFRGRRRFRRR